ncbi:MAG: DUF4136 domain-containing protein [Thermoanaerobaculia bacterium]
MRASSRTLFVSALLSFLATGCSSITFESQTVEAGRLSSVKTFCALVAPQEKVPMDPAMREFLRDKVVPIVVTEMKKKGYVEAPEAQADVVVATHAFLGVADVGAIRWNATVVMWDPWGPWVGGLYATSSIGKKGAVVVDVGDEKAQKLLWRGFGHGTGELGAGHDPAKVRRFVEKVLAPLPRAGAK